MTKILTLKVGRKLSFVLNLINFESINFQLNFLKKSPKLKKIYFSSNFIPKHKILNKSD